MKLAAALLVAAAVGAAVAIAAHRRITPDTDTIRRRLADDVRFP